MASPTYKSGRRIMVWMSLTLLLASCGYRFAGSGRLPGDITALRVAVFSNQTSETGVENTVSNSLINEFVRRGVRIDSDTDDAGAVLSGSVTGLTVRTISRSGTHTSLERRVGLTVNLKLNGKDGEPLWSAAGLRDTEAYDVASDKSATDLNRRRAIETLCRRLAETVYNRLTDDF